MVFLIFPFHYYIPSLISTKHSFLSHFLFCSLSPSYFIPPSPSSSFHHALPAVKAEFVLLGQGHHWGWLWVSGGHGLRESTEEAAGGGEAGPGYGQANGQDAGGGGETESQEVTSSWPGQYQNDTVMIPFHLPPSGQKRYCRFKNILMNSISGVSADFSVVHGMMSQADTGCKIPEDCH